MARPLFVLVHALAALWLLPDEALAATESGSIVRTTATGLFRFADAALSKGDVETAEKAYRALSSDPSSDVRAKAHFRLALIERRRGRLTQAAILLRQVLDEKPNAAPVRLQLAQLLDTMGDKEAAWREVRAAQASGLPPDVARIIDRWSDALRAARPIGASFEIAIAPDSNISRSTRSDTLGTVFGEFEIDKDSKARSGLGLSLRGQAFRRFALGQGETSLLARVSGSADLYRQSRFDDMALDLAVGPELQLGRNRVTAEVGVTQRWYGLKPYMRSARLGASIRRPLGGRTQLRLSASAALLDNRLNDLHDGKSYSAQAGIERALSSTTGVAFNLSADRLSAKDPAYSTTGWRAGLFGWRDIGRTTLTAGAELGRLRADERLALLLEARSDRLARFTVGATFRQLTFGGFAPITRLVIERNRSTVEFYDFKRVRTEFGISRAF